MHLLAVLVIVSTFACGGGSDGNGDDAPDPAFSAVGDLPSMMMLDVWVFSQNDVWLAGNRGLVHFDGVAATVVTTGLPNEASLGFAALSGRAPNDLWAVGVGGIVHFDGTGWSVIAVDPPFLISSVWAGPSAIWAVGNGKAGRYQNGTWTITTHAFQQVTDVWGISDDDVWIGGPGGLLRHSAGTWTDVEGPGGNERVRIAGRAANDVFYTTGGSSIAHFEGATTTAIESEHMQINGISVGPDGVYVAGLPGLIARHDGSAWHTLHEEGINSTTTLLAIHSGSDGTTWAVGVAGASFSGRAFRNR